ncbi:MULTISPECIES: DUF6876 family protein [unclassified Microcoleus]|uniref:DUF6876 family protein n=1 Tax=unclassified Microcoleus TaxID=2642155 RepID=UPI0025ED43BD|nr:MULTISPECIES: DUF6876 family protein [unclassified Microcoleus]
MKTKEELLELLPGFGGSETLYTHRLIQTTLGLTEGVMFLVREAECTWLIDAIASYQPEIKKSGNEMLQGFQIWELRRQQECKFLLSCKEDSETPPAYSQEIEFSDFPLDEIKLWLCNTTLLLPSEY